MMRFASIYLLIVVLVPCFILADDEPDEAKTVKKIELLGGKVKRDESSVGRPVIGVDLEGSQRLTDGHLHLLKAFDHLKHLNIRRTRVTDEGMEQIGSLTNLASLNLADCDISDAGLKLVRELVSLEDLNVSNTWITDHGLSELKELKELNSLMIARTKLSDSAVSELNKALPNLQIIRQTAKPAAQPVSQELPRLGRAPKRVRFDLIKDK